MAKNGAKINEKVKLFSFPVPFSFLLLLPFSLPSSAPPIPLCSSFLCVLMDPPTTTINALVSKTQMLNCIEDIEPIIEPLKAVTHIQNN